MAPAHLDPSPRFWIVLALTAFCGGIGGALLMKLLGLVQHAAFLYGNHPDDFLNAVAHSPWSRRLFAVLLAGALVGAVLWVLHRLTPSKPTDLSGAVWVRAGRLPFLRTTVQAVLSIVTIGLGASLGRETALKQAGALSASKFSDLLRLTPQERQILVAIGTGAGMSAAYNVPLGGALFSEEVLLGSFRLPILLPTLVGSFLATLTSWLLLPNAPVYKVPELHFSPAILAWSLAAGPLLGAAAALFVKTVGWADAHKPKGNAVAWAPLLAFALLGLLAIPYPQLLGNGKGLVQRAFADHLLPTLALQLQFLKWGVIIACLASGAPGGLFTPTMTCGAMAGLLLGRLAAFLHPGLSLDACALLGSGAFLAAATQGPISSVVMLLELTHTSESLILPLVLAVTVATLTLRRLESHSIYSVRVHP